MASWPVATTSTAPGTPTVEPSIRAAVVRSIVLTAAAAPSVTVTAVPSDVRPATASPPAIASISAWLAACTLTLGVDVATELTVAASTAATMSSQIVFCEPAPAPAIPTAVPCLSEKLPAPAAVIASIWGRAVAWTTTSPLASTRVRCWPVWPSPARTFRRRSLLPIVLVATDTPTAADTVLVPCMPKANAPATARISDFSSALSVTAPAGAVGAPSMASLETVASTSPRTVLLVPEPTPANDSGTLSVADNVPATPTANALTDWSAVAAIVTATFCVG